MGPDWLRIMLYIVIISHYEVIIIFQMARVPEIPSDVSKEGKRTEFCLSHMTIIILGLRKNYQVISSMSFWKLFDKNCFACGK